MTNLQKMVKKLKAEINGTNLKKKIAVDDYLPATVIDGNWVNDENEEVICPEDWYISSEIFFENDKPTHAVYTVVDCYYTAGGTLEDDLEGVIALWESLAK